MPLQDLLTEFNLDPRLIARDREMSVGLARAYERSALEIRSDDDRWFLHMMASATEYRRAAAQSILLSDREIASKMFDQAGRVYTQLRRPYALMMFWCCREMDEVSAQAREFGSLERIDRNQLSYVLLSSGAEGEDREKGKMQAITSRMAGSHNAPIGVLGMPVGAYTDLAHALGRRELSTSKILEALLPFLITYSMTLRRCMEDEYHWQMLAFPFHPAEPDVLGVLYCVEATLRRRQQGSLLRMLESVSLFPPATSILYSAISERFHNPESLM
jgi:hypothetical protein